MKRLLHGIPLLLLLAPAGCKRSPRGASGAVARPPTRRPVTATLAVPSSEPVAPGGLVDRLLASGQASEDFKKADAAMAEAWSRVRKQYTHLGAALVASQRAWIAFRDADCAFAGRERTGSERIAAENDCLASLTTERQGQLAGWACCAENGGRGEIEDFADRFGGEWRALETARGKLDPSGRALVEEVLATCERAATEDKNVVDVLSWAALPMAGPYRSLKEYCDSGRCHDLVLLEASAPAGSPYRAVGYMDIGYPSSLASLIVLRTDAGWFVEYLSGSRPGADAALETRACLAGAPPCLVVTWTEESGSCGMGTCHDDTFERLLVIGVPSGHPAATKPILVGGKHEEWRGEHSGSGDADDASLKWTLTADGHLRLDPLSPAGSIEGLVDEDNQFAPLKAGLGSHLLFP